MKIAMFIIGVLMSLGGARGRGIAIMFYYAIAVFFMTFPIVYKG